MTGVVWDDEVMNRLLKAYVGQKKGGLEWHTVAGSIGFLIQMIRIRIRIHTDANSSSYTHRSMFCGARSARSYFVTTARNDLGMIFAMSEGGATMEPVP